MANEIQELLKDIEDERLRSRLSAAVAELRKTKKFGLVFEEHLPELLPVYSAKVRVQARVARRDGKALLHEYPLRIGLRGPHFSGPSRGVTLQG